MKLLASGSITAYVERVDVANSTFMMGSLMLHCNESLENVYDGDVIVADVLCDDKGIWRATIKSMLTNVFIAAAANAAEDAPSAAVNAPDPAAAPAAQRSPAPVLPAPAHSPVAATALSNRSTQFNRSNTPAATPQRSSPSPTAAPAPQAAAPASSRAARFGKGFGKGQAATASGARAPSSPPSPTQRPAFNAAAEDLDDVPF